MPAYIAREPIEHDGARTEPGGELKLTEAQAAPLLAMGHVEPKVNGGAKARAKTSAEEETASVLDGASSDADAAAQQQG